MHAGGGPRKAHGRDSSHHGRPQATPRGSQSGAARQTGADPRGPHSGAARQTGADPRGPHSGAARQTSWGWHPLTAEWAERIVADAGIRPGDLVLDIGAGTGALTAPLVRAGARVLAIELHPGRVERLRARFAGDPVTVVHADARDLLLPHRPFRVVASPPYSISSELVRALTARSSRLAGAHLVLQRGFVHKTVERWSASSRWHASAGRALPRTAFRPPPQVDSRVLILTPRRTR